MNTGCNLFVYYIYMHIFFSIKLQSIKNYVQRFKGVALTKKGLSDCMTRLFEGRIKKHTPPPRKFVALIIIKHGQSNIKITCIWNLFNTNLVILELTGKFPKYNILSIWKYMLNKTAFKLHTTPQHTFNSFPYLHYNMCFIAKEVITPEHY